MSNDHAFMSRALQLAAQGLYTTDPNPRVGCVIVRDEKIIGEGFHARTGTPHAEVHALLVAGDRAVGSTIYVTLEPCSHQGRTPPCVDAVLAAKPARVVVAMQDPNPQVSGAGMAKLRAAGITVDVGVLGKEAAALNPGFIARMTRGTPFVRVKLAMSLDGRTAMADGSSQWISGAEAREDVQRWRARSGAVLTGSGTLQIDNPALTVRAKDWRHGDYTTHGVLPVRQPLRVLLDRNLNAPPGAQLFAGTVTGTDAPVLVIATDQLLATPAGADRAASLRAVGAGIEVIGLPAAAGGLDLAAVLAELGRRGINELLVEAGATLAGALVAAGLVDELVIYAAPCLLGSAARPLLTLPIAGMADKIPLHIHEVRMMGADIRICARVTAL